jgi:iron-sulfur cluster assembly accessory protein
MAGNKPVRTDRDKTGPKQPIDEAFRMSDVLDTVIVTPAAARRIARIVAGDASAKALRVSVEGGGCSGFSYRFDLAPGPEADDVVVERDGALVVIDSTSLPFMAGSEIDFVDDLMGQSFQVKNPNATASCGCGTSFAL